MQKSSIIICVFSLGKTWKDEIQTSASSLSNMKKNIPQNKKEEKERITSEIVNRKRKEVRKYKNQEKKGKNKEIPRRNSL